MVMIVLNHILLTPESKIKDTLDDFLKNNKFSRLWIKTFTFDKYYADILNKQKSCDLRVLVDDTPFPPNKPQNTPFKGFLRKIGMDIDEFKKKYFPLLPGKLHNKYIYFETPDGLREGVITGSYNLAESSKSKDNDIIIYCKEYDKTEIMPGFTKTFDPGKESVISSNIGKVKYDFTKSWIKNLNGDLICPNCNSKEVSKSIYCHYISSKTGALSLRGKDHIGSYGDCEKCMPKWCQDRSITPKNIFLLDENGELHDVFTCGDCDTIFIDNGGMIGEGLVVSLDIIATDEPIKINDDDSVGNRIIKFDEKIYF